MLANIVTGIGFALLLVAVSEFAGGIVGWRPGLLWGLAGFAVFTLAPGLGLPPELPAMPAADLAARQIWWVGTVVATAAGLALIAFRSSLPLALLGVALIVAPHIVGAPQPESYETPIPEGLHHQFVVAVTMTNLVFWVVLGALVGVAPAALRRPADGLQRQLCLSSGSDLRPRRRALRQEPHAEALVDGLSAAVDLHRDGAGPRRRDARAHRACIARRRGERLADRRGAARSRRRARRRAGRRGRCWSTA